MANSKNHRPPNRKSENGQVRSSRRRRNPRDKVSCTISIRLSESYSLDVLKIRCRVDHRLPSPRQCLLVFALTFCSRFFASSTPQTFTLYVLRTRLNRFPLNFQQGDSQSVHHCRYLIHGRAFRDSIVEGDDQHSGDLISIPP